MTQLSLRSTWKGCHCDFSEICENWETLGRYLDLIWESFWSPKRLLAGTAPGPGIQKGPQNFLLCFVKVLLWNLKDYDGGSLLQSSRAEETSPAESPKLEAFVTLEVHSFIMCLRRSLHARLWDTEMANHFTYKLWARWLLKKKKVSHSYLNYVGRP